MPDTVAMIPVPLQTDCKNKAKADLFISIHTNSAKSTSAKGTETYIYGLEQTGINMEVAKRENSVILLEEDYSATYQGYDPNSVESFIMFDFQQNKYFEQSIHFASMVQEQFRVLAKRPDRSVRQQNLLVLRLSAMPSILVEVGYISNPSDAAFLGKDANRTKLAESIYRAFIAYKDEWNRKNLSEHVERKATVSSSEVVYKVQLLTSKKKLSSKDPCFKGLSPISYYEEPMENRPGERHCRGNLPKPSVILKMHISFLLKTGKNLNNQDTSII